MMPKHSTSTTRRPAPSITPPLGRWTVSQSTLLLVFLATALLPAALSGCGRRPLDSLLHRQSGQAILFVRGPSSPQQDERWIESLDATLGGCDVLNAGRFVPGAAEQLLEGRSLVVFGHGALGAIDTTAAAKIRPFLDRGGVALLDTPDMEWSMPTGLRRVATRTELHVSWPRPRDFASLPLRADWQGTEGEVDLFVTPTPTPLDLRHEVWIHRPRDPGLRVRSSPFGRPEVWWSPVGKGGWLVHSVSLPQLLLTLDEEHGIDEAQRTQWRDAIRNALLDPDTFPTPWPRVWPRPFEKTAAPVDPTRWAAQRRAVQLRPRWIDDTHLEVRVKPGPSTLDPSSDAPTAAVALPRRWHGRLLVDWHADWPHANGRRAVDAQRVWVLVSVGSRPGRLLVEYRSTPGATVWR